MSKLQMTPEQERLAMESGLATAPAHDGAKGKNARLTVWFDEDKGEAYRLTPRGRKSNRLAGVVLHYAERPARTPTGGRYTRRGFTLRDVEGNVWYGSLGKDFPYRGLGTVRCRPA